MGTTVAQAARQCAVWHGATDLECARQLLRRSCQLPPPGIPAVQPTGPTHEVLILLLLCWINPQIAEAPRRHGWRFWPWWVEHGVIPWPLLPRVEQGDAAAAALVDACLLSILQPRPLALPRPEAGLYLGTHALLHRT